MIDLVSIIVPCYNQAQYLDEALQSVLEQSHQNWECIIINDGSTDNTEEISKKWLQLDTRFQYFSSENKGVSHARNLGISNSKGEYILPLDGDDKISKNYVEKCYKDIISNKNIKVVYGKSVKFGSINQDWTLNDYSFELLLKQNLIYCTALFRKSDWNKANGYDTNLIYGFEDWELWINILKNQGEVKKNLNCTFYYRIKEDQSKTNDLDNDVTKKLILRKYIFNKHKPLYTTQTDYDLYVENNNLHDKLFNLHKHKSIKMLFIFILKRIKFKLTQNI